MLNYRDRKEDPTRASGMRRSMASMLSPVGWFVLGVIVLGLLLLCWLVPVSSRSNPLRWMGWVTDEHPTRNEYLTSYFSVPQQMASVLPAILGVLCMAALAAALRVKRYRRAVLVLGHVASALELRVPLPPYLRAAAAGERPLVRRRLIRMARDLSEGRPIGVSLASAAGELPPLTIDRITAAEKSFALTDALGPLLQRERHRAGLPNPNGNSASYAIILLGTMSFVVCMVVVFVMPKYAQIYADFKLKLPWVTQTLIDMAYGLVPSVVGGSRFGLFFLALAIPLMVIGIAMLLTRSTRGLFTSQPARRWFRPLTDRLMWYTPGLGSLVRTRHSAIACEALAEALLAGRPMPEAIALATLPNLNVVLRRRMRKWRSAVEAGGADAASARAARLPPLWCDMLAGAHADPAAAVAFAGRAYHSAWHRRAAVFQAVLPVIVTFVMAGAVLFLALALLMPLVGLIEGMTGNAGGRGRSW